MFNTKGRNKTIREIDVFFDTIDESTLVFTSGIKNYLYNNQEPFHDNLNAMTKLENTSSELRRSIEGELHAHPLLAEMRGDVLRLLEHMENIVDILSRNLFQFEVEIPYIPVELNLDFVKLAEASALSVESIIPAAKAYFRTPASVTEKIHRVYFYEKETNKLAQSIKRKVFHEMTALKLSEKFHLRYFALHIEELSREAVKIADLLSVMAIKRNF
ncbi:MAG: DUF47 family protein [Odoribacteraceae bacterium]|nr:DUF47 family protein [Odoribacteraceae bacterium]